MICYCESNSKTGKSACFPNMARKDIKPESNYDGRTWCVSIQHPDKLIWAQRAHRDKDRFVTKASRPVIIGNCLQRAKWRTALIDAHIPVSLKIREV